MIVLSLVDKVLKQVLKKTTTGL